MLHFLYFADHLSSFRRPPQPVVSRRCVFYRCVISNHNAAAYPAVESSPTTAPLLSHRCAAQVDFDRKIDLTVQILEKEREGDSE
ncbi:hypothetical protein TSUD_323210 [Trifolium subterraneum]|uniref:Uncharacterized protein n=1 Tax=Trifolium subterraneum TaxID=3900 RepID=A0A2Z6MSM1_TRISU|nr:hypothetical protein TSUD_323210 [Trifolium subterraneum]